MPPTADNFRELKTGDTYTHEGQALTFIRFRAGKATCVDAKGNRVNVLVETPPPESAGEEQVADAENRTPGSR